MSSSSRSKAPATPTSSPSPKLAEQLGYAAFFRSDHYLAMSGDGLPGPTDSWVTLGAIARETSRIRLGTLVTSATFRYPGPLAISVAQVDEMSGGRVELGFGSGWFAEEHQAYGIPFPSVRERFDRLSEQLAIVTGLWTAQPGETFDLRRHALHRRRLAGAAQTGANPASTDHHRRRRRQAHSGTGRDICRRIQPPFRADRRRPNPVRRVADAVAAAGRAADSIVYSCAFVLCAGRDDAEVARRAAVIGRDLDELRSNSPLVGTPTEIVDNLGPWRDLGVKRLYAQTLDLSDLAHLELLADKVMPQLR